MASRLGMVPAVVCIVAAALLGGWGWTARDESRASADEEAVRSADEGGDTLFAGDEEPPFAADPVDLACDLLVSAALLEAPVAPYEAAPGSDAGWPGDAGATTLARSSVDTAWMLVSILDESLLAEVPELDQPDLRAAVVGLRGELERALARTAEPLAEPEVIAAAALLRETLVGRCL